MKITFGHEKALNAVCSQQIGVSYLNIIQQGTTRIEIDNILLFIEGEYYYAKDNNSTVVITASNIQEELGTLIKHYGVENLQKHLEGSWVGCWIDTNKRVAGIFVDILNQAPLYFVKNNQEMIFSTVLKDVVNPSKGLDQLSLYSYLLLGYTPEQDTFYQDVKKMGSDMMLRFNESGPEWVHSPVIHTCREFDSSDLNRYEELLDNAVTTRSSDFNVVMSSGGWDSTSLLYILTQHKNRETISTAVFDVILPDGQSFNKYEVDKANRIGNYFGVSTERAIIDYRDENLVEYWESHTENFRNNHTYFWLNHLKIADLIGKKYTNQSRVFNGEASDSIHNFGFSQFVSVNYDNMQLREYADKAKSYLYGTSFFDSLVNGSYANDKVLQFFQNYYGANKFDSMTGKNEIDRRQSYFESFMLSGPRVPFAKWQLTKLAHEKLQTEYSEHLFKHYFQDAVSKSNSDSLYYWLLQLYRRFHFHSYQIGVTQVALKPFGQHCVMPFLDSQLIEMMYQMPEEWGRGLELRTTKYPLRFLAENKWRMPLNILMEKGPHSYIAEGDKRWSYAGGSWNIYCEIMFKSPFSSYFKSIFKSASFEKIFDSKYFNLEFIEKTINCYIAGEECVQDVTLLFRLALLFSIGFINIQ